MRGQKFKDFLDAGGNWSPDHLEISFLHPQGDNSIGEFYSVALTNHAQQADTGTKMIHLGKDTRSTIISKGIAASGKLNNSYRGLVKVMPKAENARNDTQCDSMLIGSNCGANTFPYIEVMRTTRLSVEHEASTSKISAVVSICSSAGYRRKMLFR